MLKQNKRSRTENKLTHIPLDEGQKVALDLIRNNNVVVVTGRAGSGKSMVCSYYVAEKYLSHKLNKCYVSRSTVEVGKSIGFLPGDLKDKINPYLEAFNENLEEVLGTERFNDLVKSKKLVGSAIQFIRGKTVRNESVMIVEEVQSSTKEEVLAVLTRLGKGDSTIIFNGDLAQKDSRGGGLEFLLELAEHVEGVKHIHLSGEHRHGLIGDILNYVECSNVKNVQKKGVTTYHGEEVSALTTQEMMEAAYRNLVYTGNGHLVNREDRSVISVQDFRQILASNDTSQSQEKVYDHSTSRFGEIE